MTWNWMDTEMPFYHFKLTESEALLVFRLKRGTVATVVTQGSFTQFKREFARFSQGKDIRQVKLLGSSKFLLQVKDWVHQESLVLEKAIEKNSSLDVYYRAIDGKVKIRAVKMQQAVNKKVRALVVDDSLSMRKVLKKTLETDGDIEVVAESGSPVEALELIEKIRPDVITLDIHMPEMTGVEMLKKYYPQFQIPTIMVTSIRMEEGPLIIEALESGALDYFEKPELSKIVELGKEMRERVRIVAQTEKRAKLESVEELKLRNMESDYELLAFGASTGGTEAIRYILSSLPKNMPPIVIVQHMPEVFTRAFANRLNSSSDLSVVEAEDGQVLQSGFAYIAPGGKQLKIRRTKGKLTTVVVAEGPFNRHEPSVDVLFHSIAELSVAPKTMAMLMTGMGYDGAEGLLLLKSMGQTTAIQSRETCTVWGMPRVAHELAAQDFIWDLQQFPAEICRHITKSVAS